MALLYIGKKSQEMTLFSDLVSFSDNQYGLWHQTQNELLFFSGTPVIKHTNGYVDYKLGETNSLETILQESNNDFCAFHIFKKNEEYFITLSSARFSRARMYFIQTVDGYYFSDDLRKLIPFSSKKINPSAIYSVIKFGNVPEYITCVEGIYSVPVSSFVTIKISELTAGKSLGISHFEKYFRLNYTFEGGDLGATENILRNILSFSTQKDFIVPISGGIDSSLMNYLINEQATRKYPAYYLAFGDNDPEVPFAKEAVKNTQADLEILTMWPKDFIDAFHFQSQNLVQPIGETSAISMAHLFSHFKYNNLNILDGTLADGCYGSKNYNTPPFLSIKKKTNWQLSFNEKISSFLQLHDLKWKNRFFPRDSKISDPYLQQMAVYVGSLSNTIFRNTEQINREIYPFWEWYYGLINPFTNAPDEWMKYSIFKMVNYASNTTVAKTYDLCGSPHQMIYPFMWKDILDDQGKYTWEQKTTGNIIKYPLKKIIEKYATKDFIYRKKVGLNSSTSAWLSLPANRSFIIETVKKSAIAQTMVFPHDLSKLIKTFSREGHHPNISNLMISLASCEAWKNNNGLGI